jgi:hypothetical protein
VQAESIVVGISPADQDRPTTWQGVMQHASVVVRVSIVRSHDGLSLVAQRALYGQ